MAAGAAGLGVIPIDDAQKKSARNILEAASQLASLKQRLQEKEAALQAAQATAQANQGTTAQVTQLTAQVTALTADVSNLNSRIAEMQNQLHALTTDFIDSSMHAWTMSDIAPRLLDTRNWTLPPGRYTTANSPKIDDVAFAEMRDAIVNQIAELNSRVDTQAQLPAAQVDAIQRTWRERFKTRVAEVRQVFHTVWDTDISSVSFLKNQLDATSTTSDAVAVITAKANALLEAQLEDDDL